MYSEKVKERRKKQYLENYFPAYLAFILVYPFHLEDLEGEFWKWISDYEGFYQISNYGRVKSFKNGKVKILKPKCHIKGYLQVNLYKYGILKTLKIHRLVAETFISNPENKSEVNHKFGMKLDSYYENLEWTTSVENNQHAVNTGLMPTGVNRSTSKLEKGDVKFIRKFYSSSIPEYSINSLAKKFNVSPSAIYNVIHRKTYKNID